MSVTVRVLPKPNPAFPLDLPSVLVDGTTLHLHNQLSTRLFINQTLRVADTLQYVRFLEWNRYEKFIYGSKALIENSASYR